MYPNKLKAIAILFLFVFSSFPNFLKEEVIVGLNISYLNVFLDILLLIVGLSSMKVTKQSKPLLFIISLFFILSIFSFLLNKHELSLVYFLNGLREFIPYFFFPIIFIDLFRSIHLSFFVKYFDFFIHVFLAIQIPIAIFQFIKYGAGDHVGGTLGYGYSGVLTFTIFFASFYLITKSLKQKYLLSSFVKNLYLLLYWIPVFINETKIAFVFIIIFFLLLIRFSLRNSWKYIIIFSIILPLFFVFNAVYEDTTDQSYSNEILTFEYFEKHFNDDSDNYSDIPRFQKLVIYLNRFDLNDILFGKGIGQFKGGSTISLTPFATQYQWLLNGSRPMSFFLLVQIGIIGGIVFILYWLAIIVGNPKNNKVKYSKNIILFNIIIYIIIMFYNDSLRSLFFTGIFMYILIYAISSRGKAISKKELIK